MPYKPKDKQVNVYPTESCDNTIQTPLPHMFWTTYCTCRKAHSVLIQVTTKRQSYVWTYKGTFPSRVIYSSIFSTNFFTLKL